MYKYFDLFGFPFLFSLCMLHQEKQTYNMEPRSDPP